MIKTLDSVQTGIISGMRHTPDSFTMSTSRANGIALRNKGLFADLPRIAPEIDRTHKEKY
jgi:hypothetical protein